MMCNITTVDEFNELVSENDYVLIKFFATWCGPCKKLQQNIEIIEKEFPDVVVVGIDVDDADDELLESFDIKNVPFLVYYNDAMEVHSTLGMQTVEQLRENFLKLFKI